MQTEQKCTSRELSEKLKAAGAVQFKTQCAWVIPDHDGSPILVDRDPVGFGCYLEHVGDAFDVSELLDRLPVGSKIEKIEEGYGATDPDATICFIKEEAVEAGGELLSWYLENGYVA